jgi:Ca-activated chloride channel family protein
MLMLSPTFGTGTGAITDKQILPKDVVFCVDTSGSMIGEKMTQAQAALRYCIKHLRPKDRFNIVDFSTEARAFARELVPASEEMRKRALEYVDEMAARGGTAIEEALELSLKQLGKSERLKMILFATDGLPTIGERNGEKILQKMTQLNKEDVRIFVFGEGMNVNARLLDFLASQHRGESDYVMPKEKIDDKISAFFDRVGSPVMTDLEVEFDAGLKVTDMYPKRVSDIFKGEQVVIFGQYEGSGPKEVRLTGYVQGVRKTFVYELNFPGVSKDDKNGFVPRLWAGAKVDHLLSEIRKSGKQDAELVNEITRLAKVYGIITPYTSYLMTDDTIQKGGSSGSRGVPAKAAALLGAARLSSQLEAGKKDYADADDAKARKESVKRSVAQNSLRRRNQGNGAAGYYYEEAERQMNLAGKNGKSMTAVRYIASRTFYNASGTWYQGDYDAAKDEKKMKEVKIGSDDYMQLLKDNPRMAKYMVFDESVCNVGGNWYRVRR